MEPRTKAKLQLSFDRANSVLISVGRCTTIGFFLPTASSNLFTSSRFPSLMAFSIDLAEKDWYLIMSRDTSSANEFRTKCEHFSFLGSDQVSKSQNTDDVICTLAKLVRP